MPRVEIAVDSGDILGEGPVWDPSRGLWWVDILRARLHSLDLAGRWHTWELDETPGSLALAGEGRLLLARRDGLATFDVATGTTQLFAPIEPEAAACTPSQAGGAGAPGAVLQQDDGSGKRGNQLQQALQHCP